MPTTGDVFWGGSRGRSRTLTFRVTGTLPNWASQQIGNPDDDPPAHLRFSKGAITCRSIGENPLSPSIMKATPGANRAVGFLVEVDNGFGASASDDSRLAVSAPLFGAANNDSTYVAEWSCDDVETYFEVYFLNTGVAGANGDPNYAGPAVGDVNPRALGIRFYEVAKAGATVTASMTTTGPLDTATATCNTVLLADFIIDSYPGSAELLLQLTNNYSTISDTANAVFEADWEHLGPGTTLNDADGVMDVDIASGTIDLDVVAAYAGGSTIFTGGGLLEGEPDRRYEVFGHLYALDQDYPGSLTLALTGSPVGEPQSVALAPDGTEEFVQRTFSASSLRNAGTSHILGGAAEWEAIRTALSSASLTAAGEDPNDWVTMIADRYYPALLLSHAATTALPAPTEDGSTWEHDFGGTPGNWEGYRYLRFNLKTDANGEELTLVVDANPGKVYKITTAGVGYADYEVDLCKPETPQPDENPELWDSRYPLRNDGLPHEDPASWGIGRVQGYSLSGGTNLDVTAASLVRVAPPEHDAMVAFNDWELVQTAESYAADGSVGSVPIIQGTRGIVITTDGRRSIIEPCSSRQLMSDGAGGLMWVYSGRNARDFKDTANACPGFTCDETPYTATDGWFALDGSEGANFINGGDIYYAGWSGFHDGGGVLWLADTPTNVLGRDVTSGGVTINYQPRYHEVITFPCCGDVWGDSGNGYSDPMPLRVAKILRAAADGIAYAAPGSTVELFDTTPTEVSSDATDGQLVYRMNVLPYGKGQHDHTVQLGAWSGSFEGTWDPEQGLGTEDALQERFNARRFHRAVFRELIAASGIHLTRGPLDLLFSVRVVAGAMTFWRFNFTDTSAFVSVLLGTSVETAQIAYSPRGVVLIAFDQGGSVKITRSHSYGDTWETPELVGTGTEPAPAIDPRLGIEYVVMHDGTNFICKRKLETASSWSTVGQVLLAAAEGRAGLEVSPDAAGRLVCLIDVAGTVKRFVSTNYGEDWTEE
jgi:hypothetical protein